MKEIEQAYETLYQAVEQQQALSKCSFYEAYLIVMEQIVRSEEEEIPEKMQEYYNVMESLSLSQDQKRKVTQLVLLKGMKLELLQANHQLTPDAIGFIFTYLIQTLTEEKKELNLYDPANGMGNLLATVGVNLSIANETPHLFASEIDDLLLAISAINAEWMELPIQFFHQDGVQMKVKDMDVVLSDLPLGYYPLDEIAQNYQVSVEEGHTYAHHLLIESSMQALKEDGYGLYLLPTTLLQSEQAPNFTHWMQEKAYLQAILPLPKEWFQNEASQKGIFIFQPKTEKTAQKEVLMAEIPSLNDPMAMQNFLQSFKEWAE